MPLGKRTDCGDAKYAGVEVPFACDIVTTLEVCMPVNCVYVYQRGAACERTTAFKHAKTENYVLAMQASLLCGFDFVVAPLVHPRYRRPATSALPKGTFQPPFTRSDLLLTSAQWSGQVRPVATVGSLRGAL